METPVCYAMLGTNPDDDCLTAKNSAKATVTMLNARFGARHGRPIQHLWGWGNNDVLPKRQPLTQAWHSSSIAAAWARYAMLLRRRRRRGSKSLARTCSRRGGCRCRTSAIIILEGYHNLT